MKIASSAIIATLFAISATGIVAEEKKTNLRALKSKSAKESWEYTSKKSKKSKKSKESQESQESQEEELKTTDITILHINDQHSHIDSETFDLRGDNVPPSLEGVDRLRVNYGGFPRLVSLVKQIEDEEDNPIIKLHAGDAITGTAFYTLFKGDADAQMMNQVCFDAFALGNHEFDGGDTLLADFIRTLRTESETCPDTPVLSANLVPGDESPLKALMDEGAIVPSVMKILPGGKKVGIAGINIMSKVINSSSPDEGTTYIDERTTTEFEVKQLKAAGADIIIMLTHIGLANDLEWITQIEDVDVIVGGDSHTLMGDSDKLSIINEPKASYPTIVDNGGKKVCVVHAWEFTHGLGKLHVSFDENGDVLSCHGGIVFPFDGENFTVKTDEDYDLSPLQAAEVSMYLDGLGSHLIPVKDDADTATKLSNFNGQVSELKKKVIATIPEDICLERIPGLGRSQICTAEETADQGGGANNVVAKAFLFGVKTADFALQNAGGTREDIRAGSMTFDTAYSLLPFTNTLVTIDMTGAQVIQLLEEALAYTLTATGSGAYPYGYGIRFDVDASKPEGQRFSSVEINSRMEGDWIAIDSETVYVMTCNSYIGSGKDGYFLLETLEATDTFLEYAQTFIDYSLAAGTLLDIPLEEYSTQSYIPEINTRRY